MNEPDDELPVLTEAVTRPRRRPSQRTGLDEAVLERLRERLLVGGVELFERLLGEALAGLEHQIYEEVSARLRCELPALIERVVEQQQGGDEEERHG
ncbi:MAG: hypothetical protein JJT85_06985 [Chromatiales bacterium]|nr:hypothetical protein [Chromatiales bacterium]